MSGPDISDFARRAWIVAGVASVTTALLALLWHGTGILLLVFAGLLFALFLSIPANLLCRHTPLSHGWALVLVLVVLIGLLVAFSLNFALQMTQQFQQLLQVLPSSLAEFEEQLRSWPLGERILDQIERTQPDGGALSGWMSRVTTLFSTTLGGIVNALIVLIVGLYVACEPWTYEQGFLRLVPPGQREGAAGLLTSIKRKLAWWLAGQFVSMTVVGLLTGLGLWLLGNPMALSLGLLAALLQFIPNIGPALSVIPALLVTFSMDRGSVVYVAALYAGVQFLESYFLTPFVQRQAVKIPPGLLIVVQVGLGLFAGILGLLMAAPLTALSLVVVQRLYVEDWLGEERD